MDETLRRCVDHFKKMEVSKGQHFKFTMSSFVFVKKKTPTCLSSAKPKVATFVFALKTKVGCPFQQEEDTRFPGNVQSPRIVSAAIHMGGLANKHPPAGRVE